LKYERSEDFKASRAIRKAQFAQKRVASKTLLFKTTSPKLPNLLNSYLYSKAAKSYFDEPREKLSSRPLCGRDKTISRWSKDFVAKVYTTFCVQPKNL
jgi:hypothetical protein